MPWFTVWWQVCAVLSTTSLGVGFVVAVGKYLKPRAQINRNEHKRQVLQLKLQMQREKQNHEILLLKDNSHDQ